ncbi:MAG: glycosyltransferase [Actinomycetota bacterium]|nr:glycosyltransferase [Actinomycetota bacterium]
MNRLISIAIPAYNESANLVDLHSRLSKVAASLSDRYSFEFVICENGSSDDSMEILRQLSAEDDRIVVVRLVRNFHMEGGMLAALSEVKGDACVIMSADLQDPPELIPQLIAKWEAGAENVYTTILHRHGEGLLRRASAKLFYAILDRASDYHIPRNASDFRLVSRQAYETFNALPERVRLVRSVWPWLGFASDSIEYERPARSNGKSSFKPFVTAPFAIRSILSSSFRILRAFSLFALLLFVASLLGTTFTVAGVLIFGVPFAGFGTIATVGLLLFSLLFLFLAVISEYLAIIFDEVRGRPAYLVAERIPGVDCPDA